MACVGAAVGSGGDGAVEPDGGGEDVSFSLGTIAGEVDSGIGDCRLNSCLGAGGMADGGLLSGIAA